MWGRVCKNAILQDEEGGNPIRKCGVPKEKEKVWAVTGEADRIKKFEEN